MPNPNLFLPAFLRSGLLKGVPMLGAIALSTGIATHSLAQTLPIAPPLAQVELPSHAPETTRSPHNGFPVWVYPIGGLMLVLIFLPRLGWLVGLIVVGDREVGIILKKFSTRSLSPNHLVALDGEAGLQADTLPPGWHFGYFPWQYNVRREPVVVIPQDEIGLVVANDGIPIPKDRILGKAIECDDFQDARKFLTQGGEKGRQLGMLTAGNYRINTALFEVITSNTATQHGIDPARMRVFKVRTG